MPTSTTFSVNKQKGFTLIELLVAISILAIVSAIGFTAYASAQITGRDAKRKDDMRQLQTAFELYFQSQLPTHFYPRTPGASIDSAAAGWPTFLSSSYISQMPAASNSNASYQYTYTPSGVCATGSCTYILCVRLENTTDPVVGGATVGVVTSGAGCPAGGVRYFRLINQ